jgi:hypothetical protein
LYQITAVLRPEFAFDPKKKRPPKADRVGGRAKITPALFDRFPANREGWPEKN